MCEINATNTDGDEASKAEDWGGRWCYGRLKRAKKAGKLNLANIIAKHQS